MNGRRIGRSPQSSPKSIIEIARHDLWPGTRKNRLPDIRRQNQRVLIAPRQNAAVEKGLTNGTFIRMSTHLTASQTRIVRMPRARLQARYVAGM
jgi:hypothetical protein